MSLIIGIPFGPHELDTFGPMYPQCVMQGLDENINDIYHVIYIMIIL